MRHTPLKANVRNTLLIDNQRFSVIITSPEDAQLLSIVEQDGVRVVSGPDDQEKSSQLPKFILDGVLKVETMGSGWVVKIGDEIVWRVYSIDIGEHAPQIRSVRVSDSRYLVEVNNSDLIEFVLAPETSTAAANEIYIAPCLLVVETHIYGSKA